MITCKICNNNFNNMMLFISHIKKVHNLNNSKDYYDLYLKEENEGFCVICGKPTKFVSIKDGYKRSCSKSCAVKESKDKRKQTLLEKYGVDHPSKSNEIKERMKQTNLKKYGVENASQSEEIKEKKKKTAIENYGSLKSAFYDTSVKTIKERYSVENISQLKEIKEKKKRTTIENYGSLKSAFHNTIKDAVKEKYGVENVSQLEEIKEKKKRSFISNYGVDNIFKDPNFKNVVNKRRHEKFIETLNEMLKYLNLELLDNEYINCGYKHNWKCTICGHKFKQIWNVIQQGFLCPKCYPRGNGYSKQETQIFNFLNELSMDNIYLNCRGIIPPKELDLYLPDYNLAIEFNGLYWHSDLFNPDPYYHLNKTELCEEYGIQLIHIFEDEWIFKQNIVKEKLKQILNVNDSIKINARECEIHEIDAKTKNQFLDEFHLQGKDASVIKLGAFYNDQLVSVMTFRYGNISKGSKPQTGIWELNRFCSDYNYHIRGIAGKLLEYFKRNYSWQEIFTYADKRWSQGNLYYQLGFEYLYDTNPNYWYLYNFQRIHRFSLRKTKDDPKDIPERILRLSEGYQIIWDCGNMKFNMINGG